VISGPAIIEEAASTTVVEPGDTVTVNAFGHLVMQLNSAQ
jgi:N-methylhydantoinase A